MKAWFDALDAQERRWIVIGAAVLVPVLLYALLWQPLVSGKSRLAKTVVEQREGLQWMLSKAGEVQALRSAGGTAATGLGGRSLLAVADESARGAGLGSALKRVEPEGTDAVRVWLENAAFDDMVTWLGGLARDNGVLVRIISVDSETRQGRVNARITLQGPTA